MRDKKIDVSAKLVTQWAEDTLFEWLPGYAFGTGDVSQYKITNLGDNRFSVRKASLTEPDQGDSRIFKVGVTVREEA